MDLVAYYNDYWRELGDTCDRRRLGLLLEHVQAGEQVLEVDCGAGVLAQMMAAKGVRVEATEMSPVACDLARAKGISVQCVSLETQALPYPDGAFETVVSNSAIEHRFDCDRHLDECVRVLRPGGKLVLSLPNIAHWRCRLWLLAGRFPYVRNSPTDKTHLRFFTVAEARRLCAARGVDIVGLDGSASLWVKGFYPWIFRRRPISTLYERLARRFPALFARDFILEGRKRETPR